MAYRWQGHKLSHSRTPRLAYFPPQRASAQVVGNQSTSNKQSVFLLGFVPYFRGWVASCEVFVRIPEMGVFSQKISIWVNKVNRISVSV